MRSAFIDAHAHTTAFENKIAFTHPIGSGQIFSQPDARRAGGVPQSLTAREIERLGDLPERARAALSPIIRLVEKSFFGDQPVDQGGWKEARASYEAFAFKEARA